MKKEQPLGESEHAAEKPIPGRSLETAFSHEAKLAGDDLSRELKYGDLTSYLMVGKVRSPYGGYLRINPENVVGGVNEEGEPRLWSSDMAMRLKHAPIDHESLSRRQEFIGVFAAASPKERETKRELREKIARAIKLPLNALSSGYSFNTTEGQEGFINNFNLASYFMGPEIDQSINDLESVAQSLPSDVTFVTNLLQSIAPMRTGLTEYRKNISQEILDDLKEMTSREPDENKLTTFKDEDQYRALIRRLDNYNDTMKQFRALLYNLSEFLIIAEMIDKRDMKKIDLATDGTMEFTNMRHPFLIAAIGRDNTVPVSLSISAEKPNVFITGDNKTGKSKLVEAFLLNSILAQTFGYAFAEGGKYTIRQRATYLHALASGDVEQSQFSHGQAEMQAFIDHFKGLPDNSVVVMDEVLKSTDSLGALAIVLAVLKKSAQKGTVVLMTMHSRDLDKVHGRDLLGSAQFLKAQKDEAGKPTYQYEEGVGQADAIALAESLGLESDVIADARGFMNELEQ